MENLSNGEILYINMKARSAFVLDEYLGKVVEVPLQMPGSSINGDTLASTIDIIPEAGDKVKIAYDINDEGDIDAGKDGRAGYETTIYNNLFAKAFWGEKEFIGWDKGKAVTIEKEAYVKESSYQISSHPVLTEEGKCVWYQPSWQYHLQQMVLEENPLLYLERFL